jgi:hypothetical protein
MLYQEHRLRKQYTDIISTLGLAFPGVQPPEHQWVLLWLQKYQFTDIMAAINTLSAHPLKAKFTQSSVGRAISSLLRDAAMRRMVASLPVSSDSEVRHE